MANKNKIRGTYFENKMVKYFQKTFNLTKHECHRSQASGNFQTEYGDIWFKNISSFPFIIECKYRKNINLDWFFPKLHSEVLSWISQTDESEKKILQDFPEIKICSMIIASRPNNKDPYILIKINNGSLKLKNSFNVGGYEITTLSNIVWA